MLLAHPAFRRGLLLLIAFALLGLTAAARAESHDNRDAKLFQSWLRTPEHRAEAVAFASYLREHKVADVVPMHELLRSASMWRECRAQPFDVPPKAQWKGVRDVLVLLREMQGKKVIGDFEMVSGYRSPDLNGCAGGSKRSSHMTGFAVDIVPLKSGDDQRLCAFWRAEGKRWKMGMSRYPSGRIHVDRSSWRTWGADHTRNSSFCNGKADRA